MRDSRTLNRLVTSAAAAIIALSSIALTAILSSPEVRSLEGSQRLWLMILATSTATLLVMSILQSNLEALYRRLSEAEAKARRDARLDPLTGLGNRKFLIENLHGKLSYDNAQLTFALLLIDLDQFKKVNDTLGHGVGDALIVEVAARLTNAVPDAILARLGGDEFSLIVEVNGPEHLEQIADRILDIADQTFSIEGHVVDIGLSIGATYINALLTSSEILRRADIAMYSAKKDGGGFRLIDDDMLKRIVRRAKIEDGLRDALESRSRIQLHYQPQFTRTSEVIALEALLRWSDPELGNVSPQEAISVAEEAHIIDDLGLLVFEKACVAAAKFPDLSICVNIASRQLLNVRFWDSVFDYIGKKGICPSRLHLEIPERVLVERHQAIAPVLRKISKGGFTLVLDNYGTSNASMSFVRRHGFSRVKLDRAFLENSRTFGNIAIMKAQITLAESLGMDVVCTGVSDAEDFSLAQQAACHSFQGFYLGEPQPLELVPVDEPVQEKVAMQG